ncbi:hypothetical protein H257_15696 [Aphanomyces astaci]|uniref:Uncharacterized protein n=1 Tax=Aphanomyces astaci TaxID=112090 RepID=W4FLL9_APHAT|nr:hypothetical protein H257_15696 [Aphanomyces astaci]ETV68380.1 hypothetical protein H257_15696 [Aphanomyces astaci]RHX97223.1 hypothetical protein DYB36_007190 [Aphanomyces astaci]RHY20144.1 hypothetical protein DYB25_007005 [Aphanomyces astaci]RHY41723.1 hypothetical protein DYB34_005184 [Aphanomyces astaci]RHY72046.1 hypothetical protein DYB38_012649 [Aphanomyces astaci]|eukprot:XP_009842175.1 hypothetical protein H257_15696 [Aphanomyces astaci]
MTRLSLIVSNKFRSSSLTTKKASTILSSLPRFNVQVKTAKTSLPPRKLNESLAFVVPTPVKPTFTTGTAIENAFAR